MSIELALEVALSADDTRSLNIIRHTAVAAQQFGADRPIIVTADQNSTTHSSLDQTDTVERE